MDIRKTIREEIDDFDWVKETNPIQCKDLKGYYFFYGIDPQKYVISDVTKEDDYGINYVHYTWWRNMEDGYDYNKLNCDTFIYRVKLGNYKLFDNDNKAVDPKDLAYTDNTFDDDERKEIWEQDESDNYELSQKIDRYSITGNQWSDIEKDPNGPFVLWKDAGKPKNVTRITPVGYGRMRNAYKGDWIRYDDVYEDEWEWARATQPIELQDPKEWIGRQFGYGQEIIDQMSGGEYFNDSKEIFTINDIDENGNLTLIKHHPIYGENHDSSTSPKNLRDNISNGSWVWI